MVEAMFPSARVGAEDRCGNGNGGGLRSFTTLSVQTAHPLPNLHKNLVSLERGKTSEQRQGSPCHPSTNASPT
jgi:hypothetical protein